MKSGRKLYAREKAFPSRIWKLSDSKLQSLSIYTVKNHLNDPEAEDILACIMAEIMRRFMKRGKNLFL